MTTTDPDWVDELIAEFDRRGQSALSLDEIGEAIGHRVAGSEEVERLLSGLERAGISVVDEQGEGLVPVLRLVIQTAQALRKEGAAANVEAVAARSGLSARAVRVALLYADVLKG